MYIPEHFKEARQEEIGQAHRAISAGSIDLFNSGGIGRHAPSGKFARVVAMTILTNTGRQRALPT
jgi:hypothetical protein